MANNDHKTWSEQYGQFIYKDEDGNWMIDEFGPTDEFSLARQLRLQQNNLRSERSTLNPKGRVPNDDEGRFRATLDDDKDAIQAAQIDAEIDNLEWQIQDELEREKLSFDNSKKGKIGNKESIAVRQPAWAKRHSTWIEQAKKKHGRNEALKAWTIAGLISEAYIEQGKAKTYHQRTVFNVIKNLDCFQAKNTEV